jgi:hypothetical protein
LSDETCGRANWKDETSQIEDNLAVAEFLKRE